jgi:MarR-like DNA-binding transcriptional regulator SgrR of sgrS sRNA
MNAALNPVAEEVAPKSSADPLRIKLFRIFQANPEKAFDVLELCSLTGASRTQVNKILKSMAANQSLAYNPGGYGRGSRSSYRLISTDQNRPQSVPQPQGTVNSEESEETDFDSI